MSRLWDITMPMRPGLATWPGDSAYEEARTATLGRDGPVNVSRVTFSTHAGTHADAPFHYAADGARIGAIDPARYVGPCRVAVAQGTGTVTEEDLGDAWRNVPPRLLVRTGVPETGGFPRGFRAISPALIEALAAAGGGLIGTDAPSVDPEESKTLDAHMAALRGDVLILENLVLRDVPPGDYELIALPLPLADLDGAPVRAVLRSLP